MSSTFDQEDNLSFFTDTSLSKDTRSTAEKLDLVTNKWINKCGNTLKTELVMKHLKTIVNEDHIEDVYEAMSQGRDFYVENMTEHYKGQLIERNLVEKLNEFDRLKLEAKDRERIDGGRTIPTTEKVFRGLMSREKKKEALALQRELDQLKEENTAWMERLSNKKAELSAKRTNVLKDIEKFKRTLDMANSVETDKLVDTMKELELYKK